MNKLSKRLSPLGRVLGLSFAFSVASVASVAHAEGSCCTSQYKGGALWDLKGNVKSVEYGKQTIYPDKKVKFTEEGKVKNHAMSYDKENRPIGYGSNFGSVYNYLNVAYDDASRPERMRSQSSSTGKDEVLNYSFNYSGDVLESVLVASAPESGEVTEWSFSDYQYDPQGNWVSRKVVKKKGEDASVEEFTETRKIEYYK